jgi:hypothetical protein
VAAPGVVRAEVINPAPKPAQAGAPASQTPEGQRDFRRILETLKL